MVYAAFLQFARTGDVRWYRMMDELARHVMDVDVYHTERDKWAYNHGLFWHTVHYVDGGPSTHRSYPRRGSDGGGPDDEHNYTTGLLHHHFVTGDPLGREAAIQGAQWVIDADDGSKTIYRFLDGGRTGLATKTRHFDYHGPGRGAGNSINALVDAWRATGEERFLEKCREIIRRSIHPRDDLDARNLLDAENRWSYTVHLQALGKYLDTMAEAGRLDDDYAYARESLLHYARWMAEHERPILEVTDDLEYPNETWAAQDVRKSEVFQFAALHAEGEERARFLERATFFFRDSVRSLADFETRSYTRPVILMMRYGHMQSWFARHPDESRPAGPELADPGDPEDFVPQRLRAMKKARLLAIAGAAAGAAAIIALLLALR